MNEPLFNSVLHLHRPYTIAKRQPPTAWYSILNSPIHMLILLHADVAHVFKGRHK